MIKKTIAIITLFQIGFLSHSQEADSVNMILDNARNACKSIESIEYKIEQRGVKGKEWWPSIEAKIVQQRANVKDVGFDKTMIKVNGTIKEKGVTEPFAFAYDGDVFTYQRGKGSSVKEVENPSRQTTMGMLQQHLFMLRFFPFSQEEPFYRKGINPFDYSGKEKINGEWCYKVESITEMKMANPDKNPNVKRRKMVRREIWWINVKDFLPVAYSDGFHFKTVEILNYEN